MQINLSEIGSKLVEYASKSAEFSASRGVVTELFPFIYAASRTMSSRAISRWLETEHKVKLSAVTIAKALRESEKHWIAYTEDLEPSVRILEEAFPNVSVDDFLRNDAAFEYMVQQPPTIAQGSNDHLANSLREIEGAIQTMREKWLPLSESVRNECVHHLLAEESESKNDE